MDALPDFLFAEPGVAVGGPVPIHNAQAEDAVAIGGEGEAARWVVAEAELVCPGDKEADGVFEVERLEVGVGFSQLLIQNLPAQPLRVCHIVERKTPV